MWTLTSKKDGQTFYLLPEKEKFIVGRSNADLILKDDSSISRNHAWIYPEKDHVTVVDVGSKYGTFYNHNIENKVAMIKNAKIELKIGERIQFGQLGNEWVLSKINICTMISALNAEQKIIVQQDLETLRGRIIDAWCESCTHLTMSEIAVTVKVLYSLVANIPIVSLNYWKAYHKELQMGRSPPNPQNYLPPLGESFLNKDIVSFAPNESRKSIFSGKILIFMSRKHFDIYEPIVKKAGGTCKDLSKGVRKTELVKKTSIVIQNSSSSLSQSSSTIDSITEYVKQSGRRLIPDCEIGLAIIYCSTDKYCNPEYDVVAALIPQTPLSISNKDIIALRTQEHEILAPKSQQDKIIARRTQLVDDSNTLVEIPESAPIQSANNRQISSGLDLFGDDATDNALLNIGEFEIDNVGILKRKRQESVELPNKKQHLSEENVHATEDCLPAVEEGVIVQETASFTKSVESIQKRVGYMDLSDFLSKNTIAKRPRPPDRDENIIEGERAKRQKMVFSSDEEDDQLMVTWSYAPKFDLGKLKMAARKDRPIKTRRCKSPEKTVKPIMQKPVTEVPVPQKDPACFKSNLNSTGWLSTSNIKKEIKEESYDAEGTLEKSKWIESIKGGFEVRVKPMLFTERFARDVSNEAENSELKIVKNFKAFVKKGNYKSQNTVIATVPYVVMNA